MWPSGHHRVGGIVSLSFEQRAENPHAQPVRCGTSDNTDDHHCQHDDLEYGYILIQCGCDRASPEARNVKCLFHQGCGSECSCQKQHHLRGDGSRRADRYRAIELAWRNPASSPYPYPFFPANAINGDQQYSPEQPCRGECQCESGQDHVCVAGKTAHWKDPEPQGKQYKQHNG